MSRLPVVSGQEVIKFLTRRGFNIISQRGSHVKLRGGIRTVIVPMHDELDRGTLQSILEMAGIDRDDFIANW